MLQTSSPFTRDKGDGAIDPVAGAEAVRGEAGRSGDRTHRRRRDRRARLGHHAGQAGGEQGRGRELSKSLSNTMRKDLYAEFLFALGQEVKVVRNDDVIQKMIATEQ